MTEATNELRGQYDDFLVKSSEIISQDFDITVYLAEDASTEGIKEQAKTLIENMMKLPREEMNALYTDSIVKILSTNITGYRKTDIRLPAGDQSYDESKVIVAGEVNVEVKNVRKG